jgi:hypothetical protein
LVFSGGAARGADLSGEIQLGRSINTRGEPFVWRWNFNARQARQEDVPGPFLQVFSRLAKQLIFDGLHKALPDQIIENE